MTVINSNFNTIIINSKINKKDLPTTRDQNSLKDINDSTLSKKSNVPQKGTGELLDTDNYEFGDGKLDEDVVSQSGGGPRKSIGTHLFLHILAEAFMKGYKEGKELKKQEQIKAAEESSYNDNSVVTA